MKKQLKRIIPCFVAGIAGISYGKPIDNGNDEVTDLSKVAENENIVLNKNTSKNDNRTVGVKKEKENYYESERIVADSSENSKNIIASKDLETKNYNYKRNINNSKYYSNYSKDPDLIQINVEYKGGFAKKHRSEETPLKNQTVVMPTYHAPAAGDAYWESVTKNGFGKLPYAIINPNNGPDTQVNNNFTEQIKKNNEAGIKNIGYVKTTGFTRTLDDVYADIDKYVEFYGNNNISGIFVDEALNGNNPNEVNYMLKMVNIN